MGILWIRVRRSSAFIALPVLIAVVLAMVFSRAGWSWEAARALSWGAGSTTVLAPVLAGLAAFEAWRSGRGAGASLMATTPRGPRWAHLGALTVWLCGTLAWAIGLAAVLIVTARNVSIDTIEPTTLLRGLTALLAATSIGAIVGTVWTSVAAAPTAALAVYLLPILLGTAGIRDVFVAGGATGTLAGSQPNPAVALTHISFHLSLALAAWWVIRAAYVPRSPMVGAASALAAGLVAVTLGAYLASGPIKAPLLATTTPSVCESSADNAVDVCGPTGTRELYRIAADDLARATATVRERGPEPATVYEDGGNGRILPPEVGILTITTETIVDQHLSTEDIVAALVTPRACPALYGDTPPIELLDLQSHLGVWVSDVLSGSTTTSVDDTSATTAMAALKACDATQSPAWDYGTP